MIWALQSEEYYVGLDMGRVVEIAEVPRCGKQVLVSTGIPEGLVYAKPHDQGHSGNGACRICEEGAARRNPWTEEVGGRICGLFQVSLLPACGESAFY